ncbi:MAG: zinc ribbon domain-containing protein [Methanobrevibacter thaueri]|jgi:RNA polymerase subunit RPABC4/transcription elongation factor Spt4|uniref:zinc ribbon domain-containing protein n=1 Tax=Methanobrevibacter thaueri TaxID=190975 RepID=UPI0026EDF372|nr:zinc ribbon domain-containing protein [Methanobrevibacter thaueri]MBE6496236.1 zinc ribbon domain-containing protein [Methanobrevibacter thaueri]
METNYCPECGNKLSENTVFCPECGTRISETEKKTKFCSHCGEKIDANAEICPNCGVRLLNPIANSAGKALTQGVAKTDDFIHKYVTARNIIIIFLILIIIGLVVSAPSIIEQLTPYKQVDESYISNPVAGEKVQFDAEYVGPTTWGGGYYYFVYSYITNNDIVRVGDEYVILQGDYLDHDLYGNEGKTVHLEGRFANGGKSKEPLGDDYIYGHWFGAESIEIIG